MAFVAAAAPYLQMAGAAMGAFGAYQNSRNAKVAYETQERVNQNNAQIARWQADDALARGGRSASTARMRTRILKGHQRAAMAANGVDLGQGSALQILSDTDLMGEIDATTIKDNAAREAWALRNQAAGFTSEASLLRARGNAENPLAAGAMSLLTSAAKVAPNWYSPGSAGADPIGAWRRSGSGGD